MSVIKTTTLASDTSAEFMPTGDFVLQAVQAADPEKVIVTIDVEGRVDADAEWSPVTSWNIRETAFCRLAQLPRIRVKIRGNLGGQAVTVRWSE